MNTSNLENYDQSWLKIGNELQKNLLIKNKIV